MKRTEQEIINRKAQEHFNKAIAELPQVAHSYLNKAQLKTAGAKQLKSCQAWVWETDTLYDVLRIVYGYTATSAKHISIFRKASCYGGYGAGKWGCEMWYMAR